jgi:hypothetical protein
LGGGGSTSGAEAQAKADPFAQYRSQLGSMYSGALQPGAPVNINQMPGYTQYNTGVMQPAMQASQRAAASTGNLYSGNEQIALQKTAQQGYYGFMTDYLNRLAQGSGATDNPAQAAALGVNQSNLNDSAVMQGWGGLSSGLSALSKQIGSNTSGAVNNSMQQTGMGSINPNSGEYMGSLEF